jgi:hypothetical protein
MQTNRRAWVWMTSAAMLLATTMSGTASQEWAASQERTGETREHARPPWAVGQRLLLLVAGRLSACSKPMAATACGSAALRASVQRTRDIAALRMTGVAANVSKRRAVGLRLRSGIGRSASRHFLRWS